METTAEVELKGSPKTGSILVIAGSLFVGAALATAGVIIMKDSFKTAIKNSKIFESKEDKAARESVVRKEVPLFIVVNPEHVERLRKNGGLGAISVGKLISLQNFQTHQTDPDKFEYIIMVEPAGATFRITSVTRNVNYRTTNSV